MVPRYTIITPIVGSANQSRFLGNTDEALYVYPALGSCDNLNLYPSPSYSVAEASSSSSGQLSPGFNPYTSSIPKEEAFAPYPPQPQSDEEWLSQAYDNELENISPVASFPTSQVTCELRGSMSNNGTPGD